MIRVMIFFHDVSSYTMFNKLQPCWSLIIALSKVHLLCLTLEGSCRQWLVLAPSRSSHHGLRLALKSRAYGGRSPA